MSEYEEEALLLSHVNYPHEYGRLYDCPACKTECWCDNVGIITGESTECIFCASLEV
jgi:hypothetical protein